MIKDGLTGRTQINWIIDFDARMISTPLSNPLYLLILYSKPPNQKIPKISWNFVDLRVKASVMLRFKDFIISIFHIRKNGQFCSSPASANWLVLHQKLIDNRSIPISKPSSKLLRSNPKRTNGINQLLIQILKTFCIPEKTIIRSLKPIRILA